MQWRWLCTILPCHKCIVYINDEPRAYITRKNFWNFYVLNTFKKYLFINSCVFNFFTQILKEFSTKILSCTFSGIRFYPEWSYLNWIVKEWGFSKLSAIKFVFLISYIPGNKSKNTVKVILQNMGMNQILFKDFISIVLFPKLLFGTVLAINKLGRK